MDGFGGGDTYTYRTALYVSFPGRTIFSVLLGKLSRTEIWFCLGNYHKVQSYIYIYIYIYRTALCGSFPGRTIISVLLGKLSRTEIWFCLGNYRKVQSYIYIYIYI